MGKVLELRRECRICGNLFNPETPTDAYCSGCDFEKASREWIKESAELEKYCELINSGEIKVILHGDGTGHIEMVGE